ncbi:hypothetical protein CEXT_87791 [Caerostris extrusa]|uniref:Uncharacterized protein n=1 Tax=Caerostris extrusa TaxID=172846 RepID=A0AAV4QZH7_CAEEX|nr:hypothetical protein CEXT_87791 [Caerostris extrusa]
MPMNFLSGKIVSAFINWASIALGKFRFKCYCVNPKLYELSFINKPGELSGFNKARDDTTPGDNGGPANRYPSQPASIHSPIYLPGPGSFSEAPRPVILLPHKYVMA